MSGKRTNRRSTPSRRSKGGESRVPASPSGADITKENLFRYLQKAEQRTANLRHILDDFEATPGARKQIKDILNELVKEGKLAHHKGNRYEAPARDLIEGTIILHRDGYGFVVPKEKIQGIDSDIF